MKNRLFFSAIAVALLTFANCNKKHDISAPTPANPTIDSTTNPAPGNYSMASVLASLAVPIKTVTIDAATGGSFTGNSGTRYTFRPNSFGTATGTLITGNVDIQVAEYLNKADMLFSGMAPMCDSNALLSGGEIYVSASQNGQQLQLMPGVSFTAQMPAPGVDPTGMTLFLGEKQGNTVKWQQWDPGIPDSMSHAGDSIRLMSWALNYCNADRFMDHPNYQNFAVALNAGLLALSTDSFNVSTFYDNYNGVWPFLHVSAGVYVENHVPDIPVHFVAFGIINGNFYGGILGATPATGHTYTVSLKQTTPDEFKAQVAALK